MPLESHLRGRGDKNMAPTVVGGPHYQSHFLYTLAVERLDEVNLSSARVDSEMIISTRDRVGDFVVIAVRRRHLPQQTRHLDTKVRNVYMHQRLIKCTIGCFVKNHLVSADLYCVIINNFT